MAHRTVADWPQSFDIPPSVEIELRGVVDDQGASLRPLLGQFPMRTRDRLERNPFRIEQPIGGFEIAPVFKLIGETGGRLSGDLLGDLYDSAGPSLVSQITRSKIGLSPFACRLHSTDLRDAAWAGILSLPRLELPSSS